MSQAAIRTRKREHDGRYAFDGNLQRLCVCRHSLSVHSAGSPADCLLYSLPSNDPQREIENRHGGIEDCGCRRFQLARTKSPRDTPMDKPVKQWMCACELLFDTEYQARNCVECGPRLVFLCPVCGEPRIDEHVAVSCCPQGRDHVSSKRLHQRSYQLSHGAGAAKM